MHRYWSFPIVGALLLTLLSCKTTETKDASGDPPAQATAPTLTAVAPPPPKIEEKIQPKVDPVEAVIVKADKEYQAGLANYSAGHLEAAKENFDRAFDLLLQSGLDVRGNDRLQQEFDKLVEGVNNLEIIALQAGDGFTEQKPEPAPIDEANEVTFPVDPNIRAKAEAEMKDIHSDLPLVINDEVARYISYFSSRGRGTLEHALTRAGRYREMILRILKQEGVPQDLIYLAQAESGFHPLALSRAGARGMWQFMAGRASGYGLQRNWWLDDRQDPEKATRAAARHLKDLYNQFGDWYLAMAAYNSGPGTVQSAVQRTGYADFWQLYRRGVLPNETRNYVPIILAVTIMAKNPAQYGLDHLTPEPPLKADRVEINYPLDLRLVAECADTSVATLQELNPSLLRMTTPKDSSFSLALPAGSAEKFQQAIAAIPKNMRVWWRYHKVNRGETLTAIARQYHTTSAAIAEVNNLREGDLEAESKLIIPVAPGRRGAGEMGGVVYSKRPTIYKARKGDTVLSIADDFGVPAAKVRQWNHLRGNQVRAGHSLRIYRPVAAEAAVGRTLAARRNGKSSKSSSLRASNGRKLLHHKVKKGETLVSIASRYNTSVATLRRDNRVSSLKAGDVLVIRTP
ncbi:MAG: LysM peptidoglycan-binding domain-containing protein [Acidobacteriia bacterium]|nr:LysM peptidoglycan-binding domain-containing protein [Terriglobia bacterium]